MWSQMLVFEEKGNTREPHLDKKVLEQGREPTKRRCWVQKSNQDTLVHNECHLLLCKACFLILFRFFCFRNTRSTTVHHQKQRPILTQRIPQANTTSNFVTDSSSEGENRVLRLGKCKLNNEFSKESSAELYKSSYFRPGPKIPFSFSRSTSIPTMLNGTSDLIAIGTIPMTSQRQTPPKPMSR